MSQRVIDRLYSTEEFEKLPQFHERYELIDGRLVEKPVPNFDAADISHFLIKTFLKFDPDENLGMLRAEVSVRIREQYVPAPDLAYWKRERAPRRGMKTAADRPDLAIEIQSEGQSLKSLITKAKVYQKAGVSLVWIIQPSKKIVLVFRPGMDKPVTIQPTGELDTDPVLPGLKIAVKDLFD